MYKPVLSIDVSKSKSFAAAFLNYGEPYLKPFSFKHSPSETSLLIKHLQSLELKTGVKPEVVLEATGNFSKPISGFFEKSGYNVVVLNPLQTHQQKAKSIRKVKTDPIDANRIAQVYYLNSCKANSPLPDYIADLRNLCRQYDAISSLYIETQRHLQSILDLVFPNYDTVFSHTCCKSSLRLITAFPYPQAVLHAEHKDLKDYVKILMTHQNIMTDVRAQMIAQASLSPVYSLLRSIPGVGELTAVTILAEIGDVHRFPTVKQLVAFSGLDPSVFESGKFKATNNRISKRGSSYLRKALYQASVIGIGQRNDKPVNPVLRDFYTKKITEGKSVKVALVATCNKLLHIIFGVWRSNTPFFNVQ
jgi:transposase